MILSFQISFFYDNISCKGGFMAQKFDVIAYIQYYINHTYNVVLAWIDIQDLLIKNKVINKDEFKRINKLIILHDKSKLSMEEFAAYGAKFFPIGPITNEEEIKSAFKLAWEHHKANNPHHHQTLKDYKGDDWICYLIEMICDWIAMGWEFGELVHEYYEKHKEEIDLPILYKNTLENILTLIKNS